MKMGLKWLYFAGVSLGNVITPFKAREHVTEGTDVTLYCNYSGGTELYWYRQFLGSAPEFALYILESGMNRSADPPIPRLTAHIQKSLKRVALKISTAAVSDSAVYYCALRPTVEGNPAKAVQKHV
uniref:Ig-like domain-containing protein n=1 Tax=Denticeps clupeoides TaxID=299321 RepID=A0AAY4AH92_9TELE